MHLNDRTRTRIGTFAPLSLRVPRKGATIKELAITTLTNATETMSRPQIDLMDAPSGTHTAAEIPKFSGLRRTFAGMLLVFAVATGALGSFAEPAQAASSVGWCFKHNTTGGFYTYNVYLDYWNGSYWQEYGYIGRGPNGCSSAWIPSWLQNSYVRVRAYHKLGFFTYSGVSPYMANPGNFHAYLGWGIVYP